MFASASVTPCSSAHIVGDEPGEADDRVQDDVGLGPLEQVGRVSPGLRQRREARRSAASPEVAATSSSSGCASITSIAWRPIEPVAPSRAIRFTPSG